MWPELALSAELLRAIDFITGTVEKLKNTCFTMFLRVVGILEAMLVVVVACVNVCDKQHNVGNIQPRAS